MFLLCFLLSTAKQEQRNEIKIKSVAFGETDTLLLACVLLLAIESMQNEDGAEDETTAMEFYL